MGVCTLASRVTVVFAALLGLSLAFAPRDIAAQDTVVRVGYQKLGAFALLKARGLLEERLKPLGYTVTWTEFSSGPQLLEALGAGAMDFAHGGEAPPIFAQAAGIPLIYIGHEPAAPKAEAILVREASPIRTVADLKGKRIALNRGSNVHYLLVRALERAGLKYSDVEVVYLSPPEGRAAFEAGAVDAWAIWEPYRAAAEQATRARTLVDGVGLVSNHEFFFAARPFAARHPRTVDVVLTAARDVYADAARDIPATARTFGAALGLPPAVVEIALTRMGVGVQPMSDAVVAEQQRIADTFTGLGLIPAAINVSEAARRTP